MRTAGRGQPPVSTTEVTRAYLLHIQLPKRGKVLVQIWLKVR